MISIPAASEPEGIESKEPERNTPWEPKRWGSGSKGAGNRKPSTPPEIVTFVNAWKGGSWYDSLMKKILASLLLLMVCASPVFAARHHHHKKHHHPHQPA